MSNIVSQSPEKERLEGITKSVSDMLISLKSKAEKATSEGERKKLEQKIRLLEEEMKQVKQGASDKIDRLRDTIDDLRKTEFAQSVSDGASKTLAQGVNEVRDLADKASHSEAAEKTKTVLSEGVKEAQVGIENAVKAVQSGNLTGVRQVALWVLEGINKNGEAIRQYSGMAALEKVVEPLKNGFSFEALWETIKNFFSFMLGMGTISESVQGFVKKADDAIEKGKEISGRVQDHLDKVSHSLSSTNQMAQDFWSGKRKLNDKDVNDAIKQARKDFHELSSLKLTPEEQAQVDAFMKKARTDYPNIFLLENLWDPQFKEKTIEHLLPQAKRWFGDEFYNGEFPDAKTKDLKELLSQVHIGQDTYQKVKDDDYFRLSTTGHLFSELLSNVKNFPILLRIVPPYRLVWTVTKKAAGKAKDAYVLNCKIACRRVGGWFGVKSPEIDFTKDSIAETMRKVSGHPVSEDFMLLQMYRTNGIIAALGGTLAEGTWSAINAIATDVSISSSIPGKRISGLSFSGKWWLANAYWKGDFKFLAEEVSAIGDAFGSRGAAIKASCQALEYNILLTALQKESGMDITKIRALITNPPYQSLALTEEAIAKAVAAKNFSGAIRPVSSVNNSWIGRSISEKLGRTAGAESRMLSHMEELEKIMIANMQDDLMSKLDRVPGNWKFMKLSREADRTMLYLGDTAEDATKTLQQMNSHAPGVLGKLVRAVPTLGLMIGGWDLMFGAKDESSFKDKLMNLWSVLVPLVGPAYNIIWSDSTSLRLNKETGQVENVGMTVINTGLLTVDWIALLWAAKSSGLKGVGMFFLDPLLSVAETGANTIKMINLARQAGPRRLLVGGFGKMAAAGARLAESAPAAGRAVLRNKKIAAGVAAVALAGTAYLYFKSQKDVLEDLRAEGDLDAAHNITEQGVKKYAQGSLVEKKIFVDNMSHGFLGKGLPDASTVVGEDGIYHVFAKNQEDARLWQKALNNSELSQKLRPLGVVDVAVSLDPMKVKEKNVA